MTIPLNGMLLRGEEATDDMYTSIDMVVENWRNRLKVQRYASIKIIGAPMQAGYG